MNAKTCFLASFVPKPKLGTSISQIFDNFNVVGDRIFALTSEEQPNIFILTYNVTTTGQEKYDEVIQNTIPLHRKKKTNTLYTLNALNEVIKKENDGILDEKFVINWEEYKNCILVYREILKVIPTTLYRVFYRRLKG